MSHDLGNGKGCEGGQIQRNNTYMKARALILINKSTFDYHTMDIKAFPMLHRQF